VALSGPLLGTVFPLQEDETGLGRDPSNPVCVSDPWISRRHCVLVKKNAEYHIRDLESINGTFVNGVPVAERILHHADRISVPGSEFVFLLHEGEPAGTVQFGDPDLPTSSTREIRWQESLYLRTDEAPPAQTDPRMARDLKALLAVCKGMSSGAGLEALAQDILQRVFETVPAQRGSILLLGNYPSEDDFAWVLGRHRSASAKDPVPVSRTILRRVLGEGLGILVNRASQNEDLAKIESIHRSQTQSILSVPLVAAGRSVGVLYLDSSDPLVPFDESHLELAAAIAGLTAGALETAYSLERARLENQDLRADQTLEHNMVGESPAILGVLRLIAKVGPSDSTVLLLGESGTGKELAARAIHRASPRANKPFVPINCATLTENLLESELFGHERGAFTGAIGRKIGKIELAEGGTVFLDEIAELAPALQAKLLRLLQEHEFERVGGTRPIRVDVRFVAATNRNLSQSVARGHFRADLFYRLNVVSLVMPPLRDRREDLPLLASYFASKYAKKTHRVVRGITPEARDALLRYDWPGNIRELENAIERAVVLGSTEMILPEDLPESVLERQVAKPGSYHSALAAAKRDLIRNAIRSARGNFTEAARLLGVNPNYLHRLVNNLNLRAEFGRSPEGEPPS
jgi:Nif-specific regulatory protein